MSELKAMQDRYQRFVKHRQAFDPGAKSWYRLEQKDDTAEVYIYDAIGFFGVEAQDFIRDLERITADSITLRINSPGGDVFDGSAIYNALLRHPAKVHVKIDGLAASMASVIALAGDTVEMAENAFYMIHNPWSFVIGDSAAMRKEADILDKITSTAVGIYARNSSLDETEVRAAMDAETWYTAEEAKAAGFIDTIFTGSQAKAQFNLSVFAHAPEGISAPPEGADPTPRGLEAILRDAGMSRAQAKSFISDFKTHQRDADSELQKIAAALKTNLSIIH